MSKTRNFLESWQRYSEIYLTNHNQTFLPILRKKMVLVLKHRTGVVLNKNSHTVKHFLSNDGFQSKIQQKISRANRQSWTNFAAFRHHWMKARTSAMKENWHMSVLFNTKRFPYWHLWLYKRKTLSGDQNCVFIKSSVFFRFQCNIYSMTEDSCYLLNKTQIK